MSKLIAEFIDRWQIARCVEDGRGLPARLARRVAASRSLSEYCESLRTVDRALGAHAAVNPAPPWLAERVMTQLHASPSDEPSSWVRGLAGPALAGVVVTAASLFALNWPYAPPGAPDPAWSRPGWARLEAGTASITRTAVEAPLMREARSLARETRAAADIVLASMPSARSGAR